MLDLGIYPFKLVKEIGSIVGFNIMDFDKNNKRIKIKREKETNVDMEMQGWLNYTTPNAQDVKVYLETMCSPGSDFAEELKIKLKNGDQIVQCHYVHPHDGWGVFIEHVDGSVTRVYDPKEFPEKTSYAYQHEHCVKVLENVAKDGNNAEQSSSSHTIDEQVVLLDFIESMEDNCTESNTSTLDRHIRQF
jgi:hypothetical protein